jgi:PAS domain S-box-containing protein
MREKLSSHGGRLFLLAVGILLTSTAGHAAARLMALQVAQGSSTFAFELAVLLAALLAAAYVIATAGRPRVTHGPANVDSLGGVEYGGTHGATERPMLTASQLMQLRLPPGIRLDSHEAIMIATRGTDRHIVFVNPAFVRLTGYAGKDWVGQSADLLQAQGPLRMEALLWLDTDVDGTESHWIARLHRSDGAPFCAETHLHAVTAKTGEGSYTMAIITDVTSRIGKGRAPAQSKTQASSEPSAAL